MKKYQLNKHIQVDESAIDDICELMDWTREEFFEKTTEIKE